nr:protein FAR1-RELATED SEQUENCE 5-like [Ipomoea batatas]
MQSVESESYVMAKEILVQTGPEAALDDEGDNILPTFPPPPPPPATRRKYRTRSAVNFTSKGEEAELEADFRGEEEELGADYGGEEAEPVDDFGGRDPYSCMQAEELQSAAKSLEKTQVINTFYKCLGLANGRVEKLQQIAHALEGVETSMFGDKDSGEANLGKRATMETYCGIPAPETIVVHPPQVSKNKGSGKRIKSMKEIAIKGMRKKGRTCATCGLANGHNSRTCLKR